MRWGVLFSCVIAVAATTSSAAELYKCKGENGETVFSDQPCPGGETLPMRETPTYAAPPINQLPPLNNQANKPDDIKYSISVTEPAADAVIRDNEGKVSIEGSVKPALFEDHRVQLLLDGSPVEGLKHAPAWSLNDVERGEHSIVIQIVHKSTRKVVGSSAARKFALFRASANTANPNGANGTNLLVLPTAAGAVQQANWPRLQTAPQPGDPTPPPPTKPSTAGPRN